MWPLFFSLVGAWLVVQALRWWSNERNSVRLKLMAEAAKANSAYRTPHLAEAPPPAPEVVAVPPLKRVVQAILETEISVRKPAPIVTKEPAPERLTSTPFIEPMSTIPDAINAAPASVAAPTSIAEQSQTINSLVGGLLAAVKDGERRILGIAPESGDPTKAPLTPSARNADSINMLDEALDRLTKLNAAI